MTATEEELIEMEKIIKKAIKESWKIDASAWETAEQAVDEIREKLMK